MWLVFIVGFAIAGAFGIDEAVHPEKYPETSAANGIVIHAPPPPEATTTGVK